LTSSTPTNPEPLYVVDTHALIWYLLNDKKLSARAKALFEAAEQHQTMLIISAIVLAELYYANGKFQWFPDFRALYTDLISKPYLRFVPFDNQHVLDFDRDYLVPEMHDRIITGLAQRLNAPLITSDALITRANLVTIEW
jgi:PIN domain nuclease of toxin-antitoxin system